MSKGLVNNLGVSILYVVTWFFGICCHCEAVGLHTLGGSTLHRWINWTLMDYYLCSYVYYYAIYYQEHPNSLPELKNISQKPDQLFKHILNFMHRFHFINTDVLVSEVSEIAPLVAFFILLIFHRTSVASAWWTPVESLTTLQLHLIYRSWHWTISGTSNIKWG